MAGWRHALNGNPNQIFGPEKNKAIEIGTKWELFDRRLLLTAALFQTEKENARESQNVNNAAAATQRAARITCRHGTGNVSCITAGAAYRIRGIDLGVGGKITDKWSVFGGLVLMQSEVTKSLVPSPQPLLFPTNVGLEAGQRRASIVQPAEQVSADGRLGDRRRRPCTARRCSAERSSPPTRARRSRASGASIPSSEAKVDKNWTAKLFVANITNKLYYDALYQSATPFVFVAPGRSVSMVISARF